MAGNDHEAESGQEYSVAELLQDRFECEVRSGRVIGTRSSSGDQRRGADFDRVMAVDDGALRIISVTRVGWGRTTLSYGPFPSSGLVAAVMILNGHNTAQHEPLGETLDRRFRTWIKGNEVEPWRAHMWSWLRHGPKRWTLRRFRHWTSIARAERRGDLERLDESLLVGLLPREVSSDPLSEGHSFVMHATGAENGELWVTGNGGPRPVLRGVQNVPLYLLIAVRDDAVVYYAGSVGDVRGLPALPAVRPLAVVPREPGEGEMHLELQQAVSGQIGFAADTRVYGVAAARIDPSTDPWAASIDEPLSHLAPSTPRQWTIPSPIGLIWVRADAGTEYSVGWGPAGYRLTLSVGAHGLRLETPGGETVRHLDGPAFGSERAADLQIRVDDAGVEVWLGGRVAFEPFVPGEPTRRATTVVVEVQRGQLRSLEVHPAEIYLPHLLRIPLPAVPAATVTVFDDDFAGPPGPLEGRPVRGAAVCWRRLVGEGQLEVLPHGGARVVAHADRPLPGRIVYGVPVAATGAVEVEIDVRPPGTARHQGERGRGGVVFRQDDDNELIVATWLDDVYDGTSISSFFRLDGYEDLYDAIWTNVGRRVTWGVPYRLRVAFDGLRFVAYVDDELVLYRSLRDVRPGQSPLHISEVGLVANWEWGTDTGSCFRRFTVRTGEG